MKLTTACVSLAAGLPVAAQPCTPSWYTAPGNPGIGGGYAAPVRGWNDGSGEKLFVGGSFTTAGGSGAGRYVATWDPDENAWTALGSGISGGFTNAFMTTLIPFTPGRGPERLVVGGWYDTAGGLSGTASLAMWDGSAWQTMGTNWTGTTRGSIWSGAEWNGRLYVGGGVVNTQPSPAPPGTGYPIGGVPWQGMASWDGQTWASHVSTMSGFSPYIGALLVFNDGSGEALYAAGRFTGINGVAGTAQIARFNGSTWSSVGGGLTSTTPTAGLEGMTVFDDGGGPALFVAGAAVFGTGLPTCNVAKWNGTSWTALGGQIGTGRLTCITSSDDGSGLTLYIGGTAMPQISYIARWESGAWTPLGGGITGGAIPPSNFPSVFGMGAWQNKLYITGNFVQLNNTSAANGVAAWAACTASCYANCDASTGTPILTANDFQCFLDRFAAGESYANCDGSTGSPALTANDFQCFLDLYAAGCS